MPVLVSCVSCKRQLQVPDHGIGKTIRCPLCNSTFVAQSLPALKPAAPATPAPPAPPPAPATPPLAQRVPAPAPKPTLPVAPTSEPVPRPVLPSRIRFQPAAEEPVLLQPIDDPVQEQPIVLQPIEEAPITLEPLDEPESLPLVEDEPPRVLERGKSRTKARSVSAAIDKGYGKKNSKAAEDNPAAVWLGLGVIVLGLVLVVVIVWLVWPHGPDAQRALKEEEWKAFSSPDGSFQVQFPGKPTLDQQQAEGPMGPNGPTGHLTQTLYVVDLQSPAAGWVVGFIDIPEHELEQVALDERFNHYRDRMAGAMGAQVFEEHDLQLRGCPGKFYKLNINDRGQMYCKLYGTHLGEGGGVRLWILQAGGEPYNENSVPITRFFDSFTLTAAPTPPTPGQLSRQHRDFNPNPDRPRPNDKKPIEPPIQPPAPRESLRELKQFERFFSAAFNKESTLALVAARESKVKVLSTPTFQLQATFRTQKPAYRIALDSDRGLLYAAVADKKLPDFGRDMRGRGPLHIYDVSKILQSQAFEAQLPLVKEIALNGVVQDLLLSPDGQWLYYLDVENKKVGKINTTTQALAGDLPVPAGTTQMCLTPDGRKLYAVGSGGPGAQNGQFLHIDATTLQLEKTTRVNVNPSDIEATDEGLVFIPGLGQWSDLLVVDTRTEQTARWEGYSGGVKVKLTPDAKRLLWSDWNSSPALVAAGLVPLRVAGSRTQETGSCRVDANFGVQGELAVSPNGRWILCEAGRAYELTR